MLTEITIYGLLENPRIFISDMVFFCFHSYMQKRSAYRSFLLQISVKQQKMERDENDKLFESRHPIRLMSNQSICILIEFLRFHMIFQV